MVAQVCFAGEVHLQDYITVKLLLTRITFNLNMDK